MSNSVWKASAPSNIALIKYMGKEKTGKNRPTNNSLSLTLDHLRSYVEVEENSLGKDLWEPLSGYSSQMNLSLAAQEKYLKHWSFLKEKLSFTGHYTVKSTNDFPSDCGLASSASSFAALTLAAYKVSRDNFLVREVPAVETKSTVFSPWSISSFLATPKEEQKPASYSQAELAGLSAQGSGSSCRSFFSPWSIWDKQSGPQEFTGVSFKNLGHHVVVVDDSQKQVSSSQAHQKIAHSLLFKGRTQRAEERLELLKVALREACWSDCFELTWAEFWDMHALFETSTPAFGYMTAGSLQVLSRLRAFWQEHQDGPLVTMDAGANVHLIFREDQKDSLQKDIYHIFASEFKVL